MEQTSNDQNPAIRGSNKAPGRRYGFGTVGVKGESTAGYGVHGVGGTYGVYGESTNANASDSVGVKGATFGRVGVEGGAVSGVGVLGGSNEGIGVYGESGYTGVGVRAESTGDGAALEVFGRAAFSTSGSFVIEPGQTKASIKNNAVRSNSHISIMPTYPMAFGVTGRKAGVGFEVVLAKASDVYAWFSYIIFELAE